MATSARRSSFTGSIGAERFRSCGFMKFGLLVVIRIIKGLMWERSRSPRVWRGCENMAGDGPFDGRLRIPHDVAASPKCRIDRVEIKCCQALSDALHFRGCQGDVVGI